jgi:hypothetical protein
VEESGMTNWEHRHLGAKRAPGSLTELEIDHFFTLRPAEKAAVLSRRGAENQVGLALMIGMLRMTGRRQSRGPSAPKAVLELSVRRRLFRKTPRSVERRHP